MSGVVMIVTEEEELALELCVVEEVVDIRR